MGLREEGTRVHVIMEAKTNLKGAKLLPSCPCEIFVGLGESTKALGVPEALPHAGTEGDIPFFHDDRVHEKAIGNGHFILYDTG